MSISNLAMLGIYETAIDYAIETVEETLKKLDMEHQINSVHKQAMEQIKESIPLFDEITNLIIDCYFEAACVIIQEKLPDVCLSFYVNCNDSHFYVEGEEMP